MQRRPLIGVTADIEWHAHATPPRLHYELDAHLTRCLFEAGAIVVVLPHDEPQPDVLLDRLDGLVLSGGAWVFPRPTIIDAERPATEQHKHRRAEFELALATRSLRRRLPVLGICGGFQILNAAAGGVLDVNLAQSNPARSRHAAPDRAQPAHPVKPVVGTRFAAWVGETPFAVNSQHRQGLAVVGEGLRACAVSDDGLVEAIECPDHPFCIGVQWHPEFVLTVQDRLLLQTFVGVATSTSTRLESRP